MAFRHNRAPVSAHAAQYKGRDVRRDMRGRDMRRDMRGRDMRREKSSRRDRMKVARYEVPGNGAKSDPVPPGTIETFIS